MREQIMFLIAILIPVILLVINWFVAKQFHEIAKMKGYPERKYLWWCFWLGVVGYLMVVALPNRGNMPSNAIINTDELPEL